MRLIFPAVAACLLGGCYELPHPVLTQGERAPISGTYQCNSMFMNRRETITEASTGYVWKDYRYKNAAGESMALSKITGTHYAAEVQSNQGTNVVYLDIPSADRFSIRVPDLITQGRAIDALILKHSVQASPSNKNADFIAVSGDDKQLAAFIKDHPANLLTTLMDCNRIGS